MKKLSLFIILLLSLCPARAQQQRPTPEQLGSIYYAYPSPTETLTSAPAGYQPFYISHYGRHGSRWMTDDARYTEVLCRFDSLHAAKLLTPLGEDVRRRLQLVYEDARGCSGNISPVGERQHHEIARRMFRNFPQVFADSSVIDARSTTSLRCALSMSYFTEGLKELNPALRVSRRSYTRYMDYLAHTSAEGEVFCSETAPWRKDFRAFEERNVRPERLMKSLFTDDVHFNYAEASALMWSLYWIAADMQNVDLDLSFYDLFEYEELFSLWRVVNARMYVCNAAAPLNGGLMPRQAVPLLRNILESADKALKAGLPAADLRFGHDTHLIRLLTLMHVEGCDKAEADIENFYKAWPDYQISPMAGNLQIIFFRHQSTGDVLVKFLLNEREVKLNGLQSCTGPYYHWADVRAFWEKALD